jgi:non-specific serine/threonine protein kinase
VHIAIALGDREAARVLLADAVPEARSSGNPWAIAISLIARGLLERADGDPDRARRDIQAAVALLRDVGDRFALLLGLFVLAAAHSDLGDPQRAVRLVGAAEEQAERIGNSPPASLYAIVESAITRARAALGPEDAQHEYQVGRTMTMDHAIDYALQVAARPASA